MNYFRKLFSRKVCRKTAMMLTCSMLAAMVLPYGSLTVSAEEAAADTVSGNEIALYDTASGVTGSPEEPEIYTGGICVEPDGTLFDETNIYLKVDNGKLLKTTEEDYNFHYCKAAAGGHAVIELNKENIRRKYNV